MEPEHAHSRSVRSSLQDTIREPLALNVTSQTVELWPRPGPALQPYRSHASSLLTASPIEHCKKSDLFHTATVDKSRKTRAEVHVTQMVAAVPDRVCAHSHSSPESVHSLMLSS